MKKIKDFTFYKIIIISIYAIAICMLICAFIIPPPGIIDNSILIACSILFAFAGLIIVLYAVQTNTHAKLIYKDTHIEIGKDD